MIGLEHYLTVAVALFVIGAFEIIPSRKAVIATLLQQMSRDPAKAMDLRDFKPEQGL